MTPRVVAIRVVEIRVVEIRSYRLRPGGGPAFHAIVSEQSAPLLRAAGMDVVAFGRRSTFPTRTS